jgi:hypothetical protein
LLKSSGGGENSFNDHVLGRSEQIRVIRVIRINFLPTMQTWHYSWLQFLYPYFLSENHARNFLREKKLVPTTLRNLVFTLMSSTHPYFGLETTLQVAVDNAK